MSRELTDREKLVFYGLVKWPTLNDVELSKKINVKRPTVTAIRNKLEKEQYFRTVRIPDFQKLGCEIIGLKYGDFNPLSSHKIRGKHSGWHRFPEPIFWIASDNTRVGLSAGENYTELKKHIDYSEQTYGDHGFHTDKGNIYLQFPLSLSAVFNFLNFAPLLKKHFNLNMFQRKEVKVEFKEEEPRKFSKSERKVFYNLVKYPESKDEDIAKKVSMTRQSVSVLRKKFEKDGVLHPARIPDLGKLGFELMVFMHMHFKPHASLKMRVKGIEVIRDEGADILNIAGNLEAVMISVFENYTDFQKTYDRIISFYKENDFLQADPIIKILPIKHLRILVYDRYLPLVGKLLEIDEDEKDTSNNS